MLKAQEVPSSVDLNISNQANVVVSHEKLQKPEMPQSQKLHRVASDIIPKKEQTQEQNQSQTPEAAQRP